jgi:myo-inositol-1(or 4)-monophosphatase
MIDNNKLKDVLLDAVHTAGAYVKDRFYQKNKIDFKGTINNLVTEVDQASERIILDIIRKHYPEHGIYGEEYGVQNTQASFQWYIDPIDGTVNFANRVPLCCVSIAIANEGELLMGAVYNPMMNELFFAEKGKGATLNNQPIKVNQQADLSKAFLVTGFPYVSPEGVDPVDIFAHFLEKELPIRRLGSAALDLCWVADGRFDAFWEYKLQPYDIAAGVLILEEAGGKVTNFEGKRIITDGTTVLASNNVLHDAMLHEIKTIHNKEK